MPRSAKRNLYICSAKEDRPHEEALRRHLTPLIRHGIIEVKGSATLKPGEDVQAVRKADLDSADIVVLLMSSHFFADNGIDRELNEALALEASGRNKIIPILVSPADLTPTKMAGRRHDPPQSIAQSHHPDEDWAKIVVLLRQTIKEIPGTGTVLAPAPARPQMKRRLPARLLLVLAIPIGVILVLFQVKAPREAPVPPMRDTERVVPLPTPGPAAPPRARAPEGQPARATAPPATKAVTAPEACKEASAALKRGELTAAQHLAREEDVRRPSARCTLVHLEALLRQDYTSPTIKVLMDNAQQRVHTAKDKKDLLELQDLQRNLMKYGPAYLKNTRSPRKAYSPRKRTPTLWFSSTAAM